MRAMKCERKRQSNGLIKSLHQWYLSRLFWNVFDELFNIQFYPCNAVIPRLNGVFSSVESSFLLTQSLEKIVKKVSHISFSLLYFLHCFTFVHASAPR